MFRNKHIIRASFLGLFLAILVSILFYRYFTVKNIVLDSVIEDNRKIYDYFINEICSKNTTGIEILASKKIPAELIKNRDFIEFAKKVTDFIKTQNKSKISIYTKDEREIISSNDFAFSTIPYDLINKINKSIDDYFLGYVEENEVNKIISVGNIVHNINILNFDGDRDATVFVESFYPVTTSDRKGLEMFGTFKVVTNITDEWNKIRFFETRVSIFFLAVFFTFFGIIVFNTHHAQKIIDQQVASNKSLEEAKEKAESESSAKTQFLANVSHELRTPLNAIIGFSEVILTEAHGKLQPDVYKEYINDINNSGKHLLSVINDILDFSKASADKLKVDLIEVDANKMASSSIRFVKPRADEAKVNLVEKLPKDHVVIKADPKRLKQALLNLLSNSVKFTPENGSVTLELENNFADKRVYIRVIDTGIGMEEKDIPKALSSFGQVDNKLSRKYEGTGLGLPLTKKLVELMGGTFEITSKPNVGTKVTLTFKQEEF